MNPSTLPVTQRERELGAIINAYNEVTERLKLSHDRLVAEVRRLREQIDEKNRELARRERLAALGEMAAGVAHEIRNPLAGIQLYASLLIKELGGDKPNQELAVKIAGGVQELEGVVGDVLAFAGQAAPQTTRVELADTIADCLESVAPVLHGRGTRIEADQEIRRFAVKADAAQLRRSVLNLVLNAIDAGGEAGTVWISAARDESGGFCELRIADNGPGIPVDALDKIFNPFFTTKDSGTGLGLAIVHRVAESHGGDVEARNPASGGAELVMTMPLWVEHQTAQAEECP